LSEAQQEPKSTPSRVKTKLALIEAALYVTGKPLDLKTLGAIVGFRSEEKVRDLGRVLKEKYGSEATALEVLELSDGRFVMQLKPQYVSDVKRLATRQLLTPGPMKTLSFIAYRQPITQSYVAKVRGNLAYSHVKQLREVGLISEERLGRTKVLRTTPNFADYFNLSHETPTMKKQLEHIFENIKTERAPKSTVANTGPKMDPQTPQVLVPKRLAENQK